MKTHDKSAGLVYTVAMWRLVVLTVVLAVAVPLQAAAPPRDGAPTSRPAERAQRQTDRSQRRATQQRQQPAKIEKYQKSTPEQDQAAIAAARRHSQQVQKTLGVTLHEIETDHFLIFTDWDPREFNFLKTNLESAYRVVSRQFDIPAGENIFIGKLPVYMFAKQEHFLAFAHSVDRFPASEQHAGYYAGNDAGIGHLAMWKPHVRPGGTLREAEVEWAYVLTHEFTHAFVARYRTNRHVPMWVHEGLTEVIASSKFPRDEVRRYVARVSRTNQPIGEIFDAGAFKAEYYPIARTLVETLLSRDRRAFLRFFDDVKDGKDAEEALITHYRWNYDRLEEAWRHYLRQY